MIDIARRYLAALEAFAAPDALEPFLHDDVVFHLMPNLLAPDGSTSNKAQMLEASTRAPKMLNAQRYAIRRSIEAGDTLVLDIEWQGTLRIALGKSAAGTGVRAQLTAWLRFRDGRIVEQTNFDCYDPF